MHHHEIRSSSSGLSCASESSSCSDLSAVVALRAAPMRSFLAEGGHEAAASRPSGASGAPRHAFFSLAVLLNVLLSGALILGCTPFQDAIVRRYGYPMEAATAIWGNGFQILVMGTALLSPVLDFIGPRWFAVLGLGCECLGHGLLARTAYYSVDRGVGILSLAYGLVGLGGNMLMLATMPFCQLFRKSSTAASIMMGAYQAAGFMFMVLTLDAIDFYTFFSTYEVLAAAGLLACLVTFPDVPFTSPEDVPRCSFPAVPCSRRSCARPEGVALTHALAPLLQTSTWYFLICFSLAATVGAWCAGTFFTQLRDKGQALHPRTGESLVFWMPLVSNSTFIFTPFVGALIDARGFFPAIVLLFLTIVACVLSVWLLPLTWQWLTLVTLNWLLAVTYSVQLSYIARKYAADQFGAVMSYSTVVQSAVNVVGVFMLNCSPSKAVAVFLPPSLMFCALWAKHERR